MYYFDAHCDTLSTGRDLIKNNGHFDIERAIARGDGIQVLAAFGDGKEGQLARMRLIQSKLPDNFHVIGSVEGGDDIRSIADLAVFYRMGMQMLGLTWNNDNRLAGGCRGSGGGLTELGREVVEVCEEMDIVIDLAHASEKTFWDTIKAVKKPPVVSHACCSGLFEHVRNLTDGQIKALAEAGGVLGITFCPEFLCGGEANLDHVIEHIKRALKLGGDDAVGIGSDFDGCEHMPEGLSGVEDVPRLVERMPFSDNVKEKIMGGNFARIMIG